MKQLLSLLSLLFGASLFAASPSFQSFNTNQFNTAGSQVSSINLVSSNQALPIIAAGREPLGSVNTAYIPDLGGSVANTADMPTRGNEIWSNQKRPMVVISSKDPLANNLLLCTESNMVISLSAFQTNGLLGFTTNLNIRVSYDCENGWLTNHRDASGLLRWNTNRWPSATVNPTNATRIARTNNIEFWLMMYADTINPTNGNTECDLNPVSGANNYWHYPNGVNNLGAVEIQPLITGDSAHRDMPTFYSWGVSGTTIQDGGDFYQFMGYQDGVRRKLAYGALYPWYMVYDSVSPIFIKGNFQSWQPLPFPPMPNNHGMILNYLISTPGYNWPMGVEYDANGVCYGSNGHTTEPAGSGIIGVTIGNIRPAIYSLTNWMDNTIHIIFQSDTLSNPQNWSFIDWRAHMSLVAMFNANLWLGMPHHRYFTNAAFSLNYTNILTNGIWQDPAQKRATVGNFGVTNMIFVKPLANDNERAVWFGNLASVGSTNLTVTSTMLGYPTNRAFAVYDLHTNGTLSGYFSNSYTVSVGPTNCVWIKTALTSDPAALPGRVVTNNTPGLIGASAILTLGINTNMLIINSEGVSVAAPHSGNFAMFEIHTHTSTYRSNALNIDDNFIFRRNKGTGLLESDGLQTGATGFIFQTNGQAIVTFSGLLGNSFRHLTTFTNGTATLKSNKVAPGSITFPASTVTWTNTEAYNIELYIDNTGVTGTAISKNGGQIFGSFTATTGPVVIGLQPGEYFSETYSAGTPTAKWSPR